MQYNTEYKDSISDNEYNDMLDFLVALLPKMTKDKIIRQAVKKYYNRHKEKIYRTKPVLRHQILIEQKHECFFCHKYLFSKDATLEHKIPILRGGTNDESNLCVSCTRCNNEKGAMTVDEYLEFKHANNIKSF